MSARKVVLEPENEDYILNLARNKRDFSRTLNEIISFHRKQGSEY